MMFRRVGIVTASLMLALVMVMTAHGKGHEKPIDQVKKLLEDEDVREFVTEYVLDALTENPDAARRLIEALESITPAHVFVTIGHHEETVNRIETQLHTHLEPRCEWVEVGFNKSHHGDTSLWCASGSVLAQLDLDSIGNEHNSPIVGKALCCRLP